MAKKKKSSFRGKVRRNVDQQEANAASYGYIKVPEGMGFFSPESDTRVNLDIIPYIVTDEHHMDRDEELGIAVPGELWYKKPFKIHRGIGPNNEKVVCPTTFGKKCPICEYRQKMFKEGADKKITDALRASLRNLYVVIPIDHKKLDEKPHIWDMSQHLFQNLLNKELNEDENYETFPDLEEGWTLRIRFDEASIEKTKFPESSRIDFKERDSVYDEEILESIPSLDDILKTHTYAELETMLYEYEDVDGEDEDEEKETRKYRDADDDTPSKSFRKKKNASREEEDEEEEEDEDYEEEEEKPKRSKKPARKKQPDPEEEEDEEDEEEEEKPKRSKKPASKPSRSTKGSKKKCPEGYRFGIDAEEYDECEECEIWEACVREKEKRGNDD